MKFEFYLVVFDTRSTQLGLSLYPDLKAYIDHNYVCDKREEEYGDRYFGSVKKRSSGYNLYKEFLVQLDERLGCKSELEEDEEALIEEEFEARSQLSEAIKAKLILTSEETTVEVVDEVFDETEAFDFYDMDEEFYF